MTSPPLQLKSNWLYEVSGRRNFYVVEAWPDGRFAGRAHGWFEADGLFVLEKIEVDPAQRSKGYGTAIIEQLRAKARQERCREFVIRGVRAANEGAVRLYESLGAVGRRTGEDIYAYVISPP